MPLRCLAETGPHAGRQGRVGIPVILDGAAIVVAMGRPRSDYDAAKALHLVHRGMTDGATAAEVGATRQAVRWLRERLNIRRRAGRPRKADPVTLPHWSRAARAAE